MNGIKSIDDFRLDNKNFEDFSFYLSSINVDSGSLLQSVTSVSSGGGLWKTASIVEAIRGTISTTSMKNGFILRLSNNSIPSVSTSAFYNLSFNSGNSGLYIKSISTGEYVSVFDGFLLQSTSCSIVFVQCMRVSKTKIRIYIIVTDGSSFWSKYTESVISDSFFDTGIYFVDKINIAYSDNNSYTYTLFSKITGQIEVY